MHATALPLLVAAVFVPPDPALELKVDLAQAVLPAGRKTVVQLRVSLTGQRPPSPAQRPDLNVCLALGPSAAMAREPTIAALRRLGPADIVSVVAYDDVVQVMVPATRVSDRGSIEAGIRRLQVGSRGSALFAGVVKCRSELARFPDRGRVSRIVVVSDGAADVGRTLSAELLAEGIAVAAVAMGAKDLRRVLEEELAAATAVVARDVEVQIRSGRGVRPLRSLGQPMEIVGGTVRARFTDVQARGERSLVLEMEVDAAAPGTRQQLAEVDARFRDPLRIRSGHRAQAVVVQFGAVPRGTRSREPEKAAAVPVRIPDIAEIVGRFGNGPLDGLNPPTK